MIAITCFARRTSKWSTAVTVAALVAPSAAFAHRLDLASAYVVVGGLERDTACSRLSEHRVDCLTLDREDGDKCFEAGSVELHPNGYLWYSDESCPLGYETIAPMSDQLRALRERPPRRREFWPVTATFNWEKYCSCAFEFTPYGPARWFGRRFYPALRYVGTTSGLRRGDDRTVDLTLSRRNAHRRHFLDKSYIPVGTRCVENGFIELDGLTVGADGRFGVVYKLGPGYRATLHALVDRAGSITGALTWAEDMANCRAHGRATISAYGTRPYVAHRSGGR